MGERFLPKERLRYSQALRRDAGVDDFDTLSSRLPFQAVPLRENTPQNRDDAMRQGGLRYRALDSLIWPDRFMEAQRSWPESKRVDWRNNPFTGQE